MGRLPTRERPWPHSLGTEAVRLSALPTSLEIGHTAASVAVLIISLLVVYHLQRMGRRVTGKWHTKNARFRSTNCRKVALCMRPECGAGPGS